MLSMETIVTSSCLLLPASACTGLAAAATCAPSHALLQSACCSSFAPLASSAERRRGLPSWSGKKTWRAWSASSRRSSGSANCVSIARASAGELANIAAGLPADKKRQYSLPGTVEESIDQARQACREAIKDGKTRLQLELLLPLIGATDLDDWPGGIQQQYKAAAPLVSSLLTGLLEDDVFKKEDGGCRKYIIDSSDAVGGWESDKVAVVLFPTPETLESIEALAAIESRPLLLVNSQWQPGQVISDFGFGARRKTREDFVNSFEMVYFLKRMRMLGEDVRILRRYPGNWQVFVGGPTGSNVCVASETQQLSYKQLETVLKSREGSKAGQGWLDRLLGEFKFNQESLKNED
ncbi:unnamed protein product [Sphagnum jensenii]|uniref:DUF1995 domain-containing protein n=1 Tax=Sphagnum jensenii TaxID=128206 RepID=A0ABP0WAB1_9BRYO